MKITKENRKKAEEFVYKFIDAISPGNANVAHYRELFANMSDDQFGTFVQECADGKSMLGYTHPNLAKVKITVSSNIQLAKRLGYNMDDYAYLTDPDIGVTARTTNPVLMTTMYIRRQAQTLEHKNSVPLDDRHLDQMTDQPTGPSKGASITAPELPIGHAQRWDAILTEMVNYRGGNARAYNISKHLAIRTGEISQDTIKQFPSANKSISVLSSHLFAAHVDNNLKRN